MATAAPSAPSAAPAAAEATSESTGAQQNEQSAGQRADGKAIRPIRESLPGVVEATEHDEALAKLTGEADRASRKAGRDAQGRFVKPGAQGEAKPEELTPTAKYKFAGEDWDSQEKAEQNFRTLRGQFKAHAERAKQFDDAAASARGWHAEAQRLQAQLAELQNGQTGAAKPATAEQGDAPAAGESIDWGMFAEVQKAAAEAGDPSLATQWLAREQERVIQARIEGLLAQKLQPFEEAQQNAFLDQHTEALFSSFADYVNEDGSPAFPELLDETTAAAVGRLWREMGMDPERALTPQGAVAAVRMYRGVHGLPSAGASPSVTPPAPAPASPAARVSDAASVLEHGADAPDAGSDGADQATPEARRIVAALRRSGAHLTVPGLGFDR